MMDLDNRSTFIYTRKSLLIVFNIIVFVLWSLYTVPLKLCGWTKCKLSFSCGDYAIFKKAIDF